MLCQIYTVCESAAKDPSHDLALARPRHLGPRGTSSARLGSGRRRGCHRIPPRERSLGVRKETVGPAEALREERERRSSSGGRQRQGQSQTPRQPRLSRLDPDRSDALKPGASRPSLSGNNGPKAFNSSTDGWLGSYLPRHRPASRPKPARHVPQIDCRCVFPAAISSASGPDG